MATIIITTDFSESARNAVHYACSFGSLLIDADILLLTIYTVPSSYSADGVSLAAIRDSLGRSEYDLEKELEWFKESYPGLKIRGKEVIGDFVSCVQQEVD